MRISKLMVLGVLCVAMAGFQTAQGEDMLQPPVAKIKPKKLEIHGHVRTDNYFWLRERENSEVIEYLEAENKYTEAMTAHTKDLEDILFEEIKGRIKQTDESVPYKDEGYYYYYRYEEGKSYRIYCRKKDSMDGKEEVILDVNKLAKGHDHCRVSGLRVSPEQNILAYGVDYKGRRLYEVHFKNLDTGEEYEDIISDVTANHRWAKDNKTIFYTRQDPTTLRWQWIYKHTLGADPAQDKLVYEETDEEYYTWVMKSRSKEYIIVASEQTLSSEYRYIRADDPDGELTMFLPREENHEYSIDHYNDKFYVRTNWQATNFRLMETPAAKTDKKYWKDVIPHRDDVLLSSFEIFEDYLVLMERGNALIQLRIRPWEGSDEHYLDFGEPAYDSWIGNNPDAGTGTLRYVYQSMTTPRSEYDYDMKTREKTLLKRDEVLGGFDQANYVTERLHATARDGVKVPISIVYRKGMKRDGSNPLLIYGYGSYGSSMDASFSTSRLSLLDRGFVYAIAHIRGGQEMGRQWYENGKLLKKKNTFTDFIDCAKYLVDEKYTSPDRLFASGGSAGGLLMGAIVNMDPDLFNGIVTRVPFVDVITTMLDETIPLTTSEYDEWGNPNEKEYYDYMLSYSPYDQVEPKNYPNMLVTTGLHDSQVQYWEPAKWVAKLRTMKTDDNMLLIKTDMDAGHSGGSGRFKRYRETAFQYAFLLGLAGHQEEARTQ
jgi:oligopeptidase B